MFEKLLTPTGIFLILLVLAVIAIGSLFGWVAGVLTLCGMVIAAAVLFIVTLAHGFGNK